LFIKVSPSALNEKGGTDMKCPGQDSRYWQPGAIFEAACPQCGKAVEFFRDESSRRCRNCGHKFLNPKMDFGCASYCKYAAQCLGDLPPELMAQRDDLLKDRVAVEMKKYFGKDFKRIAHAMKVARYAEEIVKAEQGNPAVVLPAAYLHDIGIKESERKYNSNAAHHQEAEGPPIAMSILTSLGARDELVSEVCDIIAHHHHPKSEESINFKCLYDADLIVNLEEKYKEPSTETAGLTAVIEKHFLTASGRKLASELLSG
jgi:HD superfamily phosphodiesterase